VKRTPAGVARWKAFEYKGINMRGVAEHIVRIAPSELRGGLKPEITFAIWGDKRSPRFRSEDDLPQRMVASRQSAIMFVTVDPSPGL